MLAISGAKLSALLLAAGFVVGLFFLARYFLSSLRDWGDEQDHAIERNPNEPDDEPAAGANTSGKTGPEEEPETVEWVGLRNPGLLWGLWYLCLGAPLLAIGVFAIVVPLIRLRAPPFLAGGLVAPGIFLTARGINNLRWMRESSDD